MIGLNKYFSNLNYLKNKWVFLDLLFLTHLCLCFVLFNHVMFLLPGQKVICYFSWTIKFLIVAIRGLSNDQLMAE